MKSEKLQAQLIEMEGYTGKLAHCNSVVSKASVGWHLAHSLKVIHSILGALDVSDPGNYQKSFSWKKELVYFTGRIPRGRARAPKNVIPEERISTAELQDQISEARNRIEEIPKLQRNAFFEHPYFGHIKRDETPKFLFIHTEHHLKIIRDILKQ